MLKRLVVALLAALGSCSLTAHADVRCSGSPCADPLVRTANLDRTITAAGTTGAQTINKVAGTVNFDTVSTALVVTNSLVSTSSLVFATLRNNDATCAIKAVVPAAGSFTIRLTVVCTAEASVGFLVTN